MKLRTLAGLSLPLALQLAPACVGKAPDDCAPASETPYDGIDQDCDGADLTDVDGDGFDATDVGGNDCDDGDSAISPSAPEVPYDGVDQDCNGADLVDVDLDGYTASVVGGDDCDDADPLLHPGGVEVPYDGIDQDCSGADLSDVDGDGHDAESVGGDDCDDADPSVYGTADETPYDDIDQDCSGADLTDADGDGHDAIEAGGDDCDDASANTHPGAPERCDDLDADEDCNGLSDDADALAADKIAYFADADADGHGSGAPTPYCDPPPGWSPTDDDCDDADPAVNPAATEVCDLLDTDEDCDGFSDDADASVDLSAGTTYFADADEDGYGSTPSAVFCDLPLVGYARDSTDCDDTTASVNPGATEVCDEADTDEDCDGLADDADDSVTVRTEWYADADGDSYGAGTATAACLAPAGAVAAAGDCDDVNSAVNPSATEVCDLANVDEDCDGLADDSDDSVDTATWSMFYVDEDEDGYGSATSTLRCDAGTGYSASSDDCDDTVNPVNPGATEVCDAAWTDEDCDGVVDDDDPSATGQTSFYVDADGDGYGAGAAVSPLGCHPAVGYSDSESDCDDANSAVSPNTAEVSNDGMDQDCDGVDLVDADGDGDGSMETGGGDCDDTDPTVYNGAPEDETNGIDDDCDGRTDETLVCWDGSGDFRTVQRGVDGTPDGGTVEICPGTYAERVLLADRTLTLVGGATPTETVIDGTSFGEAFRFTGATTDVSLSDLAVAGGLTAESVLRLALDSVDLCDFDPDADLDTYASDVSITRSYFCPTLDAYVPLYGTASFAENVVEIGDGAVFTLGICGGTTTLRNNLVTGGTTRVYTQGLPCDIHMYNNTFADGEALSIEGSYLGEGESWDELSFHENIIADMSDSAEAVFDIFYDSSRPPDCSSWVPRPFESNLTYSVVESWLSCGVNDSNDDYDDSVYDSSQSGLFLAGFSEQDPMFVDLPGRGHYGLSPGSPAVDSGTHGSDADGSAQDLGAFGGTNGDWWQEVTWLD